MGEERGRRGREKQGWSAEERKERGGRMKPAAKLGDVISNLTSTAGYGWEPGALRSTGG